MRISFPTLLTNAIAAMMLAAGALASPSQPAKTPPAPIVTYRIKNFGPEAQQTPVTLGAVFARGDIPAGTTVVAMGESGVSIPLQIDRKATHGDRSLRHAILTLVIPQLRSGETLPILLRRAAVTPDKRPPVALGDLPMDFDVAVRLTIKGGKHLHATARELLASQKPQTWLNGPEVSEWWVIGPFRDDHGVADPYLSIQFGIRCYGKGRPVRIEADVENDWARIPHPRTEFYDAQIIANGKAVFAKSGMVQPSYTRWRKGFWWSEPPYFYVEQDLAYLKKTHAIPNYEPGLRISEDAISQTYATFEASDRAPMGAGTIERYMPTTGGRADIAPLPQWQAMYLLTMDPRLYQMTLQLADLGASFSSHYRSTRTKRPLSIEADPYISTHSNLVGKPGQLEIPDTGGYADPLVPDAAHEPALDFLPYLVTGDRFYLEELQFWSQWNEMGTSPEYRGFGKALVSWDQVRAQAWSLRTLAQAAYITPDSDPMKAALRRELKANIDWYNAQFLRNGPSANPLGLYWIKDSGSSYNDSRGVASWQDDFLTWALGYVQSLGDVDASPFLRWKGQFVVGRMVAPGFCWILAPSYTLIVRESAHSAIYSTFAQIYRASLAERLGKTAPAALSAPCASQQLARALGVLHAGEMVENAGGTDGYSAYMQPALAAATGLAVSGAREAWCTFVNRPIKPDYSIQPGWDIVPFLAGSAQR